MNTDIESPSPAQSQKLFLRRVIFQRLHIPTIKSTRTPRNTLTAMTVAIRCSPLVHIIHETSKNGTSTNNHGFHVNTELFSGCVLPSGALYGPTEILTTVWSLPSIGLGQLHSTPSSSPICNQTNLNIYIGFIINSICNQTKLNIYTFA